MAAKLCSRCEVIINGILNKRESPFFYDEDWDGLNMFSTEYIILSSKSGCNLCIRLLAGLLTEAQGKQPLDGGFLVSIGIGKRVECLGKIIFYSTKLKKKFCFDVMDLDKLGGDGKEDWVNKIAESDETFSKSSIEICKGWLEKCNQHKDCISSTRNRLPSRLLDVEAEGLASQLRLCSTTDLLATEVSYMTLSHCWGDPSILEPVKLTKERYDAYLKHMDLSRLPKTFQDAISITRSFGCKYLWIDALCIIQGDQKDWLKEGLRMDEVYGSSYLNIAAASGSNAHDGCFSGRDATLVRGFTWKGGNSNITTYCTVDPYQLYRKNVLKAPLTSRAWVFQERYLAPRTLYFCAQQLFWECSSSIACETYPLGVLPELDEFDYIWSKRASPDPPSHWIRIIEAYSRGSLTHPSDKLIALSGVAKRYASENQLNGSDYLAGLWRYEIIEQLGWRVFGRGKRDSNIQIPSWSWLSVDTPIGNIRIAHTLSGTADYKIKVVEVYADYIGDFFGDVRGGFLKLRCETMLKATEYPLLDDSYLYPDESIDESLGDLYLVPYCYKKRRVICFLLQASAVRGTYRRVGIRTICDDDNESTDEIVSFKKAQRNPECTASDEDYEESLGPDQDGKLQFVIRIV